MVGQKFEVTVSVTSLVPTVSVWMMVEVFGGPSMGIVRVLVPSGVEYW